MRYVLLFVLSILFQNINASEVSELLQKYSQEKYSFQYSIEQERPDVAKLLLLYYPEKINEVTEDGHSAFELALQYGYEELALELLDHGANPHQQLLRRDEGMYYFTFYTPLYFAITAKSIRCVQKLLDIGADTSFIYGKWVQGNKDKISAPHLAAQQDDN